MFIQPLYNEIYVMGIIGIAHFLNKYINNQHNLISYNLLNRNIL